MCGKRQEQVTVTVNNDKSLSVTVTAVYCRVILHNRADGRYKDWGKAAGARHFLSNFWDDIPCLLVNEEDTKHTTQKSKKL